MLVQATDDMSRAVLGNWLQERRYALSHALEIGALDKPWLTRHLVDAEIDYLDFADSDELRRLYRNDPSVDFEQIVHVGHVLQQGARYDEFISKKFDVVFSSHCVEHQPNFIKHLEDVWSILKPGGSYLFLMPDYRFVFDTFRPASTIVDVLEAFYDRRTRPSFRNVLEHRLLASGTSNDSIKNYHLWSNSSHDERILEQQKILFARFNLTRSELERIYNDTNYRDAHVWKFFPDSIAMILDQLRRLKLMFLEVEIIHKTTAPHARYEFGVVLTRTN